MVLMGALQVKNVPDDVHRELRRRAAAEGTTVGHYVLEVLRRDLALPSRQEWLARVTRRRAVTGADVAEALGAAREQRAEQMLDTLLRRSDPRGRR